MLILAELYFKSTMYDYKLKLKKIKFSDIIVIFGIIAISCINVIPCLSRHLLIVLTIFLKY